MLSHLYDTSLTVILEENAVNLAYGLIALQNNYNLDGFSAKRQDALHALVTTCPKLVSPYVAYTIKVDNAKRTYR
jgi:hypothetical protein